ncbi:MAG: transglycosylase SLT domain-containing protein [Rhodospirillales bacterium]|nr:transglycosylase SLT domain-containing protein [Rhodospirillales bacterium]
MTRSRRSSRLLTATASVAAMALLAACSSQGPAPNAKQETARYMAHAKRNYVPPGPPEDPWGPYIHEAASRFDVPELWIRSVMRVESGGRLYHNGELVTSNAGAMGLMQVMPATYDELRARHNLGDDPFNPRDNILAGTAYLREMYDIYGSPGFLAAYNGGPGRLDDYLTNNRALPDETRRYVAMIGPNIMGVYPQMRSPAEQYAMNALPINIPPGTRYGRAAQLASRNGGGGRVPISAPIQVAQLPEAPRPRAVQPQQVALVSAPPPPPQHHGFQIIPSANAAEAIPLRRGAAAAPGQWAIQVGAFASEHQARAALGSARQRANVELAVAHPYVGAVQQARGRLWRARLTGLSRETAVQACEKLSRVHTSCIVLSPDAQL